MLQNDFELDIGVFDRYIHITIKLFIYQNDVYELEKRLFLFVNAI